MRQVNIQDTMSYVCKAFTFYNDMNTPLYLAYRKSRPEMLLTYGSTKEDFYPLDDILDEIVFIETTPFKYLIFEQLNSSRVTRLVFKEEIAFVAAMMLEGRTEKDLLKQLDLEEAEYRKLIAGEASFIFSNKGRRITRKHLIKFLHIQDDIDCLKYYEKSNLLRRIDYENIPTEI